MKVEQALTNEQILARLLIDIVLAKKEQDNYLASFLVYSEFEASVYASKLAGAIARATLYMDALAKDDYAVAERVVTFLNLPSKKENTP